MVGTGRRDICSLQYHRGACSNSNHYCINTVYYYSKPFFGDWTVRMRRNTPLLCVSAVANCFRTRSASKKVRFSGEATQQLEQSPIMTRHQTSSL